MHFKSKQKWWTGDSWHDGDGGDDGGGKLLVLLGVLLSEMLRNAGEVELSALLTALARLACVHRLVLAFGV